MIADVPAIVFSAAAQAFGKPLVTNVVRGLVVEAIVASALCPDWAWCSADYASWDFQHAQGAKLEVKQSAMRQSWTSARPAFPRWDIAPRTGFWTGDTFTTRHGRNADVYVLALHPVTDNTADHRDPMQWRFFVVPAASLPAEARTIGLSGVERLGRRIGIERLAQAVSMLLESAPLTESSSGSDIRRRACRPTSTGRTTLP